MQAVKQAAGGGGIERHRREGNVAQGFHQNAAETHHQQRPEALVPVHAEDHLEAGWRHRLYQDAQNIGVGPERVRGGQDLAISRPNRRLAGKPERQRTGLALVRQVRRLHFERYGTTDLGPGGDRRLGVVHQPTAVVLDQAIGGKNRPRLMLRKHRALPSQVSGDRIGSTVAAVFPYRRRQKVLAKGAVVGHDAERSGAVRHGGEKRVAGLGQQTNRLRHRQGVGIEQHRLGAARRQAGQVL